MFECYGTKILCAGKYWNTKIWGTKERKNSKPKTNGIWKCLKKMGKLQWKACDGDQRIYRYIGRDCMKKKLFNSRTIVTEMKNRENEKMNWNLKKKRIYCEE